MTASRMTSSLRKGSAMVRSIHVASAVFVLLFVASVFAVLVASVRQANEFGMVTERKLVQREFQREIDEVVRNQADVSFNDETARQLGFGRKPDPAFLTATVSDGLWRDFGFSWVIFASGNKGARLAFQDGAPVAADAADQLLFWIDDLMDEAGKAYAHLLRRQGDSYRLAVPPSDPESLSAPIPMIHAADMRMINGQLSIVVVQAVVPHSLRIDSGTADPTLMVTVKPISAKMLQQMDGRLGVAALGVRNGHADGLAFTPVGKGFTDGPFVVSWQPNAPGPFIWSAMLPVVVLLSLMAASAMGFIAWRFSGVVHALQRSEESNRYIAKHDSLTGLANRGHLDETLATLTSRPGSRFALIALDLDRFKAVNDQYGHAAGDAVLMAVSERFRERVGTSGFVARMGGDEFMAVIDGRLEPEEIAAIASGLVIDAQVPVSFGGTLLQVGGSAGIAHFPKDGNDLRAIQHSADLALYAAKNGGRNRAVQYETVQPDGISSEFLAHA